MAHLGFAERSWIRGVIVCAALIVAPALAHVARCDVGTESKPPALSPAAEALERGNAHRKGEET